VFLLHPKSYTLGMENGDEEKKQGDGIKIYFSDYFDVPEKTIKKYGAFNISLVADLPLFIDPFLLFHSKKTTYKKLHSEIIKYLAFLRDRSSTSISPGLLKAWYRFPEVKQNWFGFTGNGNEGHGLGNKFAVALNGSLENIFKDFGNETVTKSSHLEKLCLIREGVGRDNISDFTTNLIKGFLLEYTQNFAIKYLDKKFVRKFTIRKARFNYGTESWEDGTYNLPFFERDYVILTPRDILTKDETWINKEDLFDDFEQIPYAIPNEELRAQLNNYFNSCLPKKTNKKGKVLEPSQKDIRKAAFETLQKFPEAIDYYIKRKEDTGELAEQVSLGKVEYSEELFLNVAKNFSSQLDKDTQFYSLAGNTYDEARTRIKYLKDSIENNNAYRIFYDKKGNPIEREEDIQVLFRLVWCGSPSSVDSEVDNGRGPVDYKISRGSLDSSLVEFKLAKNKHLKKNLEKQLDIYQKANKTEKGIYVIIYFSENELFRVRKILKELNLEEGERIVLIDARRDNKPSASKS